MEQIVKFGIDVGIIGFVVVDVFLLLWL